MKAQTLIWLGGYLSPSEMLRDVRNCQPGRPENYRHAVHIISRCFYISYPLCTYTILSKSCFLFPRTSVLIFGQIKPLLAMVITVACLWLCPSLSYSHVVLLIHVGTVMVILNPIQRFSLNPSLFGPKATFLIHLRHEAQHLVKRRSFKNSGGCMRHSWTV
jgi:hypothetical protein